MKIRKASVEDLDQISEIYDRIHTEEEQGRATIGWIREVYPVRTTAENALKRKDLFVEEEEGRIIGTAILNRIQVPEYAQGDWQYPAPEDEIMVMHTLVIDPEKKGSGYGAAFEAFYEKYALEQGCRYLRIDTNARNTAARNFYRKLGYREVGIVPCVFNGIEGVQLVLLEKQPEGIQEIVSCK